MNIKLFRMILLLTSFFLAMNIAACGQSGPLILPNPNVATSTNTPATTEGSNSSGGFPAPTINTVT